MAGLLRHAWRYSLSGTLTTLASLVSFPLLTRLLSVDEYGLMNTVALALTVLVAISKLGMQKAAVRFYHEALARSASEPQAPAQLVATLVYGVLALGALTTCLWIAGVALLPAAWLGDPRLRFLLLLSSALVLIRVADSAFGNLLYAQERSGWLSLFNVAKRYSGLAIMVAALWWFGGSATSFFSAAIVSEGLAALVVGILVLKAMPAWPSQLSAPLFARMVTFGLPMVGVEIAWGLLSMGDRYVIQRLLGAQAVGVYSASYNMCDYVKLSTLAALSGAAVPMYMRIWEHEGREATERFFRTYARWHFAAAFLVCALVTASAEPLIRILASAKYLDGIVVVPWVMLGLTMESYVAVATAGLMLKKRTAVMFWFAAGAAILNLALNFALIPLFGLVGSAIATLVAFGALLACALIMGRSELVVPVPLRIVGVGLVAFGVSSWAATHLSSGHPLFDLLLRSAVVVAIYAPMMWFADAPLRDDLRRRLTALWQRRREGKGG